MYCFPDRDTKKIILAFLSTSHLGVLSNVNKDLYKEFGKLKININEVLLSERMLVWIISAGYMEYPLPINKVDLFCNFEEQKHLALTYACIKNNVRITAIKSDKKNQFMFEAVIYDNMDCIDMLLEIPPSERLDKLYFAITLALLYKSTNVAKSLIAMILDGSPETIKVMNIILQKGRPSNEQLNLDGVSYELAFIISTMTNNIPVFDCLLAQWKMSDYLVDSITPVLQLISADDILAKLWGYFPIDISVDCFQAINLCRDYTVKMDLQVFDRKCESINVSHQTVYDVLSAGDLNKANSLVAHSHISDEAFNEDYSDKTLIWLYKNNLLYNYSSDNLPIFAITYGKYDFLKYYISQNPWELQYLSNDMSLYLSKLWTEGVNDEVLFLGKLRVCLVNNVLIITEIPIGSIVYESKNIIDDFYIISAAVVKEVNGRLVRALVDDYWSLEYQINRTMSNKKMLDLHIRALL
jgi:hypothetical protein